MSRPHRHAHDLAWTAPNTAAVILLSLAAAAALAARSSRRALHVGEQVPLCNARIAAATEKINPNAASLPSLLRLPGIGPAKAGAIIEYRQTRGPAAFRTPRDLEGVRGLGPVTVQRIAPWLSLPSSAPATAHAVPPESAR